MRNPPRRSRPKKPGTTIDLEATARPAVGYPGPVSGETPADETSADELSADEPSSGENLATAADPESRLADEATRIDRASVEPAGEDGLGGGGGESHEPGERRPAAKVFPAAPDAVKGVARGSEPASTAGADAPPSATEVFAAEEGLAGTGDPRPRQDGEGADYDEDTVLAAAEPDLGAQDEDAHSGPPAPSYDYNTPSVVPDPRGGGGFGTAFGAALLGAVVALAAAGVLQYAGLLPSVGADVAPEALQQYARTGDVQQVSADLGVVRDQVAQLQSAQAAGGAGTGVTSAELTAVTDRVGALEQRAAAPTAAPAAPTPADNSVATAARDAATQAAEKAEAARLSADKASQAIGEVQRTATEAAETAGAAKQTADKAGETAGASQKSAEAAETAATQAAGTAGAALKAAEGAQGTAGAAQQAATAAQASAAAAAGTAAALGPRMAALEDSSRRAGIALSAAGLKTAIDRGGPFMGELETFASAAGDSPAIATLRGFAAAGVPSAPTLAAEWPDAQGAILKALKPLDPDAKVGDQVLSGLGSLFSVRPSGTPAASVEGPEAAVARLDAPMKTGDLKGWLSEWEKLPQAAKDASRAFRERVEARIETDRVVGDSVTKAVSSAATPG